MDKGIRLILVIERCGASVVTEAFVSQYRCPRAQLTSWSTPGYARSCSLTSALQMPPAFWLRAAAEVGCDQPVGWVVHV